MMSIFVILNVNAGHRCSLVYLQILFLGMYLLGKRPGCLNISIVLQKLQDLK